jgi:hypothetical protein
MAGQRDLQAAAQALAVDGRDHRLAAEFHPAKDLLEAHRLVEGLLRGRQRAQAIDVGAGEEVLLARAQDQSLDRVVGREAFDQFGQGPGELVVEHVHRTARGIHRGGGDAVGVDAHRENFSHLRSSR